MKNLYTVKKATEDDAITIQGIADKIWKKTFSGMIPDGQVELMYNQQYTVSSLKEQMKEGQLFFLLNNKKTYIGFMSIFWDDMDKGVMKLSKFYLIPESHGTDGAEYFINYLKDYVIKECQGSRIVLNVNRGNGRAISFYKKMNFQIVQTVDIPLEQYMLNDYIMSLDLSI